MIEPLALLLVQVVVAVGEERHRYRRVELGVVLVTPQIVVVPRARRVVVEDVLDGLTEAGATVSVEDRLVVVR